MGRSSAELARQNRAKIITHASRLFRARGVEAVSVADIMAAADMTVGGFYKHFASKEALIEEAATQAFHDATAFWAAQQAGNPDARARLVANYLAPDHRRRCPIIAFAPYSAGRDEGGAVRATCDVGTAALLAQFRGLATGAAPDTKDADHQTLLLFAAMIGARVLSEAAGDTAWLAALKQAVIDAARQQSSDPGTRPSPTGQPRSAASSTASS